MHCLRKSRERTRSVGVMLRSVHRVEMFEANLNVKVKSEMQRTWPSLFSLRGMFPFTSSHEDEGIR
jgi:hypothetical protein